MRNKRWIGRAAGYLLLSIIFVMGLSQGFASLAATIPGTFMQFDAPGAGKDAGQGTNPTSINENGDVAGFYKDANSSLHGFVRYKDGTFITLDAPGASITPGLGTAPQSINNDGEVAGFFTTNPNSVRHGFVRRKDGTFVRIDPPGSVGTVVQNINGHGDITGNYVVDDMAHAFVVRRDGTLTTFDPPGSANTAPNSINDRGDITGYFADENNARHGFLRHADGSFENFDAPGALAGDGTGTFPMCVNQIGEITGYYNSGRYNGLHGFLRHQDGTFVTFDPPGTITDSQAHQDEQGYLVRPVTGPMSITEEGEIAGYFGDVTSLSHGFVRHRDGTFNAFDAPGANRSGDLGTFPQAMNKAGDIVGYYYEGDDAVMRGFVVKQSSGLPSGVTTIPPNKPR